MRTEKKLDVVSVRLYPEELEILQQRARVEGFASLSAYIRSCMRNIIGTQQTDTPPPLAPLEARIRQLESRLVFLEHDGQSLTTEAAVHPNGKAPVE